MIKDFIENEKRRNTCWNYVRYWLKFETKSTNIKRIKKKNSKLINRRLYLDSILIYRSF